MPRVIVVVLTLVFLALSVVGLIGLGRVVLRPFPDEHEEEPE